ASGSLTFNAGETNKTITILVDGDIVYEPDETFFVDLSNAANASVGQGRGTGTIKNDDAQPAVSINDITVLEGNSGTTPAVFTVSLSAPSEQTVSVNFATVDGTAQVPADYQPTQGILSFAGGEGSGAALVTQDPTIILTSTNVLVSWSAALDGYQLQVTDEV